MYNRWNISNLQPNRKLKHSHVRLPYVPTFPFLGIYPDDRLEKMGKLLKEVYPRLFIRIGTTYWNQLKCAHWGTSRRNCSNSSQWRTMQLPKISKILFLLLEWSPEYNLQQKNEVQRVLHRALVLRVWPPDHHQHHHHLGTC